MRLESVGSKLVTAGPNVCNFDCRILFEKLDGYLQRFLDVMVGVVVAMKAEYSGCKSYRQEDLLVQSVEQWYDAHNAAADVNALPALIAKVADRPKWIRRGATMQFAYDVHASTRQCKQVADSNKHLKCWPSEAYFLF